MRTIKTVFVMLLFVLPFLVQAQVKTNFNNKELISNQGRFKKAYKEQIDFEMPAKDINKLLEKEKKENGQSKDAKLFRLAEPIAVDLDIAKLINWVVDSGYAHGKFTIKINGALSNSINFDQFYLPKGTESISPKVPKCIFIIKMEI